MALSNKRENSDGCPFYRRVRSRGGLRSAWNKVRENGLKSKCERTRKAVIEFSLKVDRNLERIYRRLLHYQWKFEPAEGILKARPGKDPRPIVVAPIENRIVQRSVLDVLQEERSIEQYYKVETSFGGIKERSVRQAVRAAYNAMTQGASYYIKSDIKDFFTKIPRQYVFEKVAERIDDSAFNKLFQEAASTELGNLGQLGKRAKLFPTYEIGVAQGCCLSPLMGNILLNEFDLKMNGREITTLRYVDDFIILGPNRRKVFATFMSARKLLSGHGLEAYDPSTDSDKASTGETKQGFEFLGCQIVPGLISPNRKARNRLLSSVKEIIRDSVNLMSNPKKVRDKRCSLAETLSAVSNVVRGWGNQYSFCNNRQILQDMDSKIDSILDEYLAQYRKRLDKMKDNDFIMNRRRLLGVHLLVDSKFDPVIESHQR